MTSHSSQIVRFLLLAATVANVTTALGGERAFHDIYQMDPVAPADRPRLNVCDRYEAFDNGTLALEDGLNGLQLSLAMAAYKGAYFNYDEETGIDKEYPGMQAVVLDELARRGGWTWRQSFGITTSPPGNHTWVELLKWSIDVYDMHISWWSPTTERLQIGSAIVKEWYDASIILVSKERPVVVENEINFWNWLRPYSPRVWLATIMTILVSGVVYQILEWYADDRQERSMWEWWLENAYMSALNFTQAYEYQPKTLSTRLFGVSMAIWALVMTATYTANLASLLVDRKPPPFFAETLEDIIFFEKTICTWEGTIGDEFLRTSHPNAKRIPIKTNLGTYQALHDGMCDYVADAVTNWHRNKGMKEYNPHCDLFWVGGDRVIHEVMAGFVAKADSGKLCSGFVRDVLGFHMYQMWNDGFMENAWIRDAKQQQDINCDTYDAAAALLTTEEEGDDSSNSTRRRLRTTSSQQRRAPNRGRVLKANSKGAAGGAVAAASAAAGGAESAASEALTMESMVGTFAFHWVIMAISLVIANMNALYVRHRKKQKEAMLEEYEVSIEKPLAGDLKYQTTVSMPESQAGTTTIFEDSVGNNTTEPIDKPHDIFKSQISSLQKSQTQMETTQAQLGGSQMRMLQSQQQMLEDLHRQMQTLLNASPERAREV